MQLPIRIPSFNLITIHVLLLLASFYTVATSNDRYLLSCGAPITVNNQISDFDNQTWQTDDNSTFSHSFSTTAVSNGSTTSNIQQIPFSTARIFNTKFTYSFPVSPGPKFIRFSFFPSPSPYIISSTGLPLPTKDAYLTVNTDTGNLLLQNFSAYLSLASNQKFVQKEFYLNVPNSILLLTFQPTWPASHAFINGIEVVSVPENLYVRPEVDVKSVPSGPSIQLAASSTALQTIYRLNVGGLEVTPTMDVGGMYRRWDEDEPYLIDFPRLGTPGVRNNDLIKYAAGTPNYSAPPVVYQSFRHMGSNLSEYLQTKGNLTWKFEVDLGFSYLLRLHWCDVAVQIRATHDLLIDVYIQNQIADSAVDIYRWVGNDTAVFQDYIFHMDTGSGSRGPMELALLPDIELNPTYRDVMLNGLELFKINQQDGSLSAPNPSDPHTETPSIDQTPLQPRKSSSHTVVIIAGAVIGAIVIALLVCFFLITHRRKRSKTFTNSSGTGSSKSKFLLFSFGKSSGSSSNTTKRSGSSLPSHLCRRYSLSEIKIATSDFTPSLIIGHGGFGNVYKATLPTDSGPTDVAIKRLNPLSGQGAREFTTEIELLSKLRHLHLVSLIGYCDDSSEMILVYEFMARGTLRDHLYPNPNPNPPLAWPRRLKICIAAARGLHYLHTGTHRMIIHRDVKSTNILLDHNFVAKVSDFGLSKLGPIGGESTHVSTAVKGSFGYVDPEYYRRQQLTEKSDVYSFGVVLFEVLCGRAAVNPALPREQVNLRIWASRNVASDTLDTIVDPNLKGQIGEECLRKFGEVAESCVRDDGASRPSMVDVIWELEFALQLQMEAGGKIGELEDSVGGVDFFSTNNVNSPSAGAAARLILSSDENLWASSVNHSSSGLFSSSATSDHLGGSTDVFSQIFNPEGR